MQSIKTLYRTCDSCKLYAQILPFFGKCSYICKFCTGKKNEIGLYSISEYIKNFNSIQIKKLNRNIQNKIKSNLRARLRDAIKNNQKIGSAVRDLGCSIEFLRKYLESKFKPGMSWDNYGRYNINWSIDHIKPLSVFDLTDQQQFLEACNYKNLQPLWVTENSIKGGKYNGK